MSEYVKTIWKNREVEKPKTFTLVNNPDGTITLIPAEGTIIEAGTAIIAATMNKMEDGIEAAQAAADAAQTTANTANTGQAGKLALAGGDMSGLLKLKNYAEKRVNVPAALGSVNLDMASGNTFWVVMAGAITLSVVNAPLATNDVSSLTINISNGPGSAITFPANWYWSGGIVPNLAVAGKQAVISAVQDVNGNWMASLFWATA